MGVMDPISLPSDTWSLALRLLLATGLGAAIGFNREMSLKPAGLRTHALVALGAALVTLIGLVLADSPGGDLNATSRVIQGILAGIGFIGGGVILHGRQDQSVHGLTTAASIWITAAIGVLVGIGFYFPAALAAALTLGTLAAFRWFETRMPAQSYAHFMVRFARDAAMPEPELRELVRGAGFDVANLHYRLTDDGRHYEYRMMVRTYRPENLGRLSELLLRIPAVIDFRISPTGD